MRVLTRDLVRHPTENESLDLTLALAQRSNPSTLSSSISANNATVRLHRARKALRDVVMMTCKSCANHGCADCGCRV